MEQRTVGVVEEMHVAAAQATALCAGRDRTAEHPAVNRGFAAISFAVTRPLSLLLPLIAALVVSCRQQSPLSVEPGLATGPAALVARPLQPTAELAPEPSPEPSPGASAESADDGFSADAGQASEPPGLLLHLRQGSDDSGAESQPPLSGTAGESAVSGQPLDSEVSRRLLARAPALAPGSEADQPAFRFPTSTRPPPRAGADRQSTFPPTGESTPATVGDPEPLTILRRQPLGEVARASHLSVTFSQPMVPLAMVSDQAAVAVPLRLSPQPVGAWRWLDTRTLVFEPGSRFAQATQYRVTIDAGTASAVGGTLAEPVSWRFSTAAPSVIEHSPRGDSLTLEPLLALVFDQPVDDADVLAHARLAVRSMPFFDSEKVLRLADEDELAEAKEVQRLIETHGAERVVVMSTAAPLPRDSTITLDLADGVRGMEGERLSESDWSHEYRTLAPLTIVDHAGTSNRPVSPHGWLSIDFNNPLDADSVSTETVSIEPAVPGFAVSVYNQRLVLRGDFRGRGRFEVTLSEEVRDVHGQTLLGGRTVTLHIAPLPPHFSLGGGTLQILDPELEPSVDLQAWNVGKVQLDVSRVRAEQWPALLRSAQELRTKTSVPQMGQLLKSLTLDLSADLDVTVEKTLGLGSLLNDGPGQLLVRSRWSDSEGPRSAFVWLQRTGLGLHAAIDAEELLVWVTDLSDGTPLSGTEVSLQGSDMKAPPSARSDATGLARLTLPTTSPRSQWLMARRGDDVALLPENRWIFSRPSSSGWVARDHGTTPLFYVFDDRGLYKPGEQLRVKGWVRQVAWTKGGDTTALPHAAGRLLGWRLNDARRVERARGTAELDAFGGFALSCQLPDDLNLGQATLELALDDATLKDGSDHRHTLQIQEYRLPEYEVSVSASPGSVVVGHDVELSVEAHYYTGGALPDAPVSWSLDATSTSYSPPGWPGFSFGVWSPWWIAEPSGFGQGGRPSQPQGGHWEWQGTTDSAGGQALTAELLAVDPPRPMQLRVQAAVTDVNQQQWVGTSSVLVHPSAQALGLRTERGFVTLGEPLPLSLVVVDLNGHPVADREIAIVAARTEWVLKDGQWGAEERSRVEVLAVSESEPVTVEVQLPEGGSWTLTASCADSEGRPYVSSRSVWVSGARRHPSPQLSLEQLTLVSDKLSYAPGDVAEVLVVAPFSGGHGLYTLRREGIVSSGTFTMEGSDHTLRLPITAEELPAIELSVEVVGSTVRSDITGADRPDQPPRPAYAFASITLSVPPELRRLTVTATPALTELSPGDSTSVTVSVVDARGEGVPGAQVALVVVDEAVLALTRRQLPDPLNVFHPQHPGRTSDHRGRDLVSLGDPDIKVPKSFGTLVDRQGPPEGDNVRGGSGANDGEAIGMLKSLGYMGADDYAEAPLARKVLARRQGGRVAAAPEPIRLRSNFDVLAAFVPSAVTEVGGRVEIPITLPDRLTRYRILAVAVEGGARGGLGESSLTARLPLMVRPSPPRFLNVGDRAELPLVLHNGLDEALLVDLALSATGLELVDGDADADPGAAVSVARRVLVPARGRVALRFDVLASRPGQARLSVVAAGAESPELSDAARFDFPVLTPATSEAFATYGHLDDGLTVQPLLPPEGVLPGFGGLELTLSTTAVAELTDAVLQLANSPYQCAEQRASRVLALAVLGDLLAAFEATGLPSPEELTAQLAEDIGQLADQQNSDGGWSFWRRDERSDPYLSVHVTHALLLAERAGWRVPGKVLARGMEYVATLRGRLGARSPRLPGAIERVIRAYGLALEQRAGHEVSNKAHDLLRGMDIADWPLDGLGWLLPVLAADDSRADDVEQIHRQLANRVVETASAAHFVDGYDQDGELVLAAPRRADAVVLDGLLAAGLDPDLQPKLVRGLLSHRVRGAWSTTQESVFALLALSRYFALHEGVTPDLTADLWLGERLLGEESFVGRSTERSQLEVPLSALGDEPLELTLQAAGAGRLYWRMGLSYAPLDGDAPALSAGFAVEREYEALDDPTDVTRDQDGGWIIRRGARVAVRLTLVNTSRRFHVALVDRLPGGFEMLNSAFAVTGALPEDRQALDPVFFWRCWFWGRQWYEHENLRDSQAEVFARSLSPGVHHYSYVVRATTPGRFVVPAAKAEEMYAPESFGRSAASRVRIE